MPPTSHFNWGFDCGMVLVCAECRRDDLPYRAWCCARRHLYTATGTPACQRFPGRELPSPMPTAWQPDELSVSSNSPHSSLSTAPPGRSRCFTWVLLLYSALEAYLSSFPLGTWQPCHMLLNHENVHRILWDQWNVTQLRLAEKELWPH